MIIYVLRSLLYKICYISVYHRNNKHKNTQLWGDNSSVYFIAPLYIKIKGDTQTFVPYCMPYLHSKGSHQSSHGYLTRIEWKPWCDKRIRSGSMVHCLNDAKRAAEDETFTVSALLSHNPVCVLLLHFSYISIAAHASHLR